MTVTDATFLLHSFRTKIEEAIALVPGMGAEEKLKAVQFWNFISEKLQEIVNNSAADINAFALKMEEEENAEKLSLDIHGPAASLASGAGVCASHFMNISPSFTVCADTTHDYATSGDLTNGQVAPFLPDQNHSSVPDATTLSKDLPVTLPLEQPIPVTSVCPTKTEDLSTSGVFSTFPCMPKADCTQILSSGECNTDNSETHNHSELLHTENTSPSTPQPQKKPQPPVSESPVASRLESSPQKKTSLSPITRGKCSYLLRKTSHESRSPITRSSSKTGRHSIAQRNTSLKRKNNRKKSTDINPGHKSQEEHNTNKIIGKNLCLGENSSESDGDLVQGDSYMNDDTLDHCENLETSDSKILLNQSIEADGKENNTTEIVVIKSDGGKFPAKNGKSSTHYTCEWCSKQLPNSSALTSHRWIHTKPYSCTECNAHFSTKGNLIVHQRRHTGEKPYSCIQCNARFSTKGNLKRHTKTHSGEKPWLCTQCGGRFTEKKSLKVHMRRHTGEKPYQCEVCGKKFAQNGILQTHMAMHLDQKAHLCDHCGKSFRQKSQLRLHMLRHEGVRKYLCPTCPSRFLTKGDLERHNRVHTGVRPFVCELCEKTFTRQQSLNEHMNRHYGLKPYECKYCMKTFAEMSACYKHIKQHERAQQSDNDILKSSCETSYPDTPPCEQQTESVGGWRYIRLSDPMSTLHSH